MNRYSRLLRFAERFALIFTLPVRSTRRRIQRWIATRTPRIQGPWLVNRRRVYILPTRFGYGYAVLLLVMLMGAMNYSNSMAFALTFLLSGMGLVAMHHTHANLVDIQVRQSRLTPVFAGEQAQFTVELDNPSAAARYSLGAAWQDDNAALATSPGASDQVDLDAAGSSILKLSLPATQRGWLPAPRFAVATEFPLGLFHAWTWVELDMACLVYPQLAPRGPQPPPSAGGQGTLTGGRNGQDDFFGLRNYQRGDTPRSIHWKSLPKLRAPLVKQFAETLENELWLDWAELPAGWDVERRLSQLARWVVDASDAGRIYALRLPGRVLAPAQGSLQRHECLKALALFESH